MKEEAASLVDKLLGKNPEESRSGFPKNHEENVDKAANYDKDDDEKGLPPGVGRPRPRDVVAGLEWIGGGRRRRRLRIWVEVGLDRDRQRKTLRILDRTIFAREIKGFAGGNRQVSMMDAEKTFFVVLADAHLEWLVGTRNDASGCFATMEISYPLREGIFRAHYCCMWQGGKRWLCISETCRRGRSYFVKIPVESHSDRWPSLWKFLGGWMEGLAVAAPVTGTRDKSYAAITNPLIFAEDGDYWLLFQAWAQKSWGVLIEDRMLLSDGLWMIKLPSKGDVARIMTLGTGHSETGALLLMAGTPGLVSPISKPETAWWRLKKVKSLCMAGKARVATCMFAHRQLDVDRVAWAGVLRRVLILHSSSNRVDRVRRQGNFLFKSSSKKEVVGLESVQQ
ncbi:hypothetical protein LINGRAHAP2_LOCUS23856 [Linum grandiflorum]